jgi:hypothetical protein
MSPVEADPCPVTASIDTSLHEAFDRFGDFVAVQGPHVSVEAIDLLQAALGIDDEARRVLAERLETDFQDDFTAPPVLLGLILGLSAAQLAGERGAVA